jgi:hypothetical protein
VEEGQGNSGSDLMARLIFAGVAHIIPNRDTPFFLVSENKARIADRVTVKVS